MIYGCKDNLSNYKGISKNLDIAINYIAKNDIAQLPLGKTDIAGEDIYVNVMECTLIEKDDGEYEYHKKYIDLHIDLDGTEKIVFSEKDLLSITHDYEEENDYALGKGQGVVECVIDNNHFCLCMEDEPHMPCVTNGMKGRVRKAVFKIKVDDRGRLGLPQGVAIDE